jgi:hypothetical protein
MSNEQNHLETLRRLDEEMTNIKELQDSYLQLLEKQFPKLTSEEMDRDSMILRSLANKIESNRRTFKYSQKNQTSFRYFGLDESGYTRLKKDYKGKSERYAKAFLSMIKVRDSQWRTPIDIDRDLIKQTNDIHLACWFMYFDPYYGAIPKSKDQHNWFQSYLIEPKFSVGDIVSLRASLPEGAVKYEYDWGRGHVGFKMKHVDKSFKKRTFMILGEYKGDTGSRYYEKTYKPNANGGMRRYKVLPVGDTNVYFIIERCLKKNRTKAVKDAKRT